MNEIIQIIKNWKDYKSWREIIKGKKPINMKRGVGYYFPVGLLGATIKGRIDEVKMESGRVAIAELIDYSLFRDPSDMIEKSYWHVSGYKGEKLFKDMTFTEYLKSTTKK